MSNNFSETNSDFFDSDKELNQDNDANELQDKVNDTHEIQDGIGDHHKDSQEGDGDSLEGDGDSQELTPKVYLTKEEAEAECKLHTHNSLLSLGRQVEKDQSNKEGLDNLFNQLKDKFKDLPKFDLSLVDRNFNIDSYLYLNKVDNFKFIDQKELFKLYILYLLSEDKYLKEVKETNLLKEEISDLNDQGDEYIKQLEELEKSNEEKESKVAKRIINLRQKCIDRRIQINRMWYSIYFLCYTSVFTLNVTIQQFYYAYTNLIIPFIQQIIFLTFVGIKHLFEFLMTYKIVLGMLISFVATYFYLNYNKKKHMLKKEN